MPQVLSRHLFHRHKFRSQSLTPKSTRNKCVHTRIALAIYSEFITATVISRTPTRRKFLFYHTLSCLSLSSAPLKDDFSHRKRAEKGFSSQTRALVAGEEVCRHSCVANKQEQCQILITLPLPLLKAAMEIPEGLLNVFIHDYTYSFAFNSISNSDSRVYAECVCVCVIIIS